MTKKPSGEVLELGSVEKTGHCWTTGIDVTNEWGDCWASRIVVYGTTREDAVALRQRVLDGLATGREAPAADRAVSELAGDFVEHSHPQFGAGYFCTPDVFARIDAMSRSTDAPSEPRPLSERVKLVEEFEYAVLGFSKLGTEAGRERVKRASNALVAALAATQAPAVPATLDDETIWRLFEGMDFSNKTTREAAVEFGRSILARTPTAGNTEDARSMGAVSDLIAKHAAMLPDNPYCYFELAYTRSTEWMAWICSKPSTDDPGRKVVAKGQGATPDEACLAALTQASSTGGAAS